MIRLNAILIAAGVDPSKVRLLRHKHQDKFQRLMYRDAMDRNPRFEQYQAGQDDPKVVNQLRSAEVLAAFVVDPRGQTVFVGLWRVHGVTSRRVPDPYHGLSLPPKDGSMGINLERMQALDDYSGRIVIDWGGGTRSWVQYAERQDKLVLELRQQAYEERFPGFTRFVCGLDQIAGLPVTWTEALRSNRGVYLIVHRQSGAQYVGSAAGIDGFRGRWIAYADGHGGNVALRDLALNAAEYDVKVFGDCRNSRNAGGHL